MKLTSNKAALTLCVCILPTVSQAAIIDFDFTGRLIVAGPDAVIIANNGSTYTDISASLTYDTVTGLGGSGLSITMNGADFLNAPPTFHDITMQRQGNTNFITGEVLVDWNGTNNMSLHIEWDATGLFNAIDFGLQAGDVLSGTNLYHDTNGNGIQDGGETTLLDINSAIPFSDGLTSLSFPHTSGGPAPMAATANSLGLGAETPFEGVRGYFDIGTGNSLHVTSVSTVPVPAAVWLFGSGLIGLIGIARRKKA